MREPRLWIPTEEDYPSHSQWLGKVEAGLSSGERHALFATIGGQTVGAVVSRQGEVPNTVDIRNISISPDVKGRYFGAFLLRNSECLAREITPDVASIRVDTKATNLDMIAFLHTQGYSEIDETDLCNSGALDVVLEKSLLD